MIIGFSADLFLRSVIIIAQPHLNLRECKKQHVFNSSKQIRDTVAARLFQQLALHVGPVEEKNYILKGR